MGLPVARAQGSAQPVKMLPGAFPIIALFILTLMFTVWVESALHLPAVIAMMTALGLLKIYGYFLKKKVVTHTSATSQPGEKTQYDIFRSLERSEWDALMFLFACGTCCTSPW